MSTFRRQPKNVEFHPKNNLSSFVLLALIFVTISCATKSLQHFSEFDRGQWEAKVLIQDKKQNKSHIIHLDIVAVKPSQLRIEAQTPLGIDLAQITLNGEKVQYLMVRQKQFLEGKIGDQKLEKFLDIPVNVKTFFDLLFEDEGLAQRMTCEKDSQGFLKKCSEKNLSIDWLDRKGDSRTVRLARNEIILQVMLSHLQPKVEAKLEYFSLAPPNGFKVLR